MPHYAAHDPWLSILPPTAPPKANTPGGGWPETVAVNLWGLDSIKSKGESVGVVLALVGAVPVREGTGRVARWGQGVGVRGMSGHGTECMVGWAWSAEQRTVQDLACCTYTSIHLCAGCGGGGLSCANRHEHRIAMAILEGCVAACARVLLQVRAGAAGAAGAAAHRRAVQHVRCGAARACLRVQRGGRAQAVKATVTSAASTGRTFEPLPVLPRCN